MAFKIGDTVSILNEVGKYQIIGISGSRSVNSGFSR
jgi:hypothetical protein